MGFQKNHINLEISLGVYLYNSKATGRKRSDQTSEYKTVTYAHSKP